MDPLLADRRSGDYRLMPGSPASCAGRDLGFALPPDRDGRCYATPPSLGAHELE